MRHHQTKDLRDKDIMVSYSSVPFKEKCYLFTNTAREEVCVIDVGIIVPWPFLFLLFILFSLV